MQTRSTIVALFMAALWSTSSFAQEEVTFTSSDGVKVYADTYPAEPYDDTPLLILFHQSRANGRAEYERIAPEFLDAGFNLMVVDLRTGGNHFGGTNRTTDTLGQVPPHCEAYPDLVAALKFAQSQKLGNPIFAVGSSYSAALVTRLGAEHSGTLSGVIAFSPATGGNLRECGGDPFAKTTQTPTMIVRPRSEMGRETSQVQYTLYKDAGHTVFIHEDGTHGASTLDPERVEGDVKPAWDAVMAFLNKHK